MNSGIATTRDGEWTEDELLGLVMDACLAVCVDIREDIARGVNVVWYDKSLLHEEIICQKVTDGKSMVDIYDLSANTPNECLVGFEGWMNTAISNEVASNQYKHYIN